MTNRKRNARLRFGLTDKEKELFEREKKRKRSEKYEALYTKNCLGKEAL